MTLDLWDIIIIIVVTISGLLQIYFIISDYYRSDKNNISDSFYLEGSEKNSKKIEKTVVFDFSEDLKTIDSEQTGFSYLKDKSSKKKGKHSKKHKKQDTDSEILHLIKKIDKKIKKGYTFESISVEHYERAYKDEILNLYNTSRLSDKMADSVEEILHLLLNNLRKPGESIEEKLEIKASVSTLNTMLEMDGIKRNVLDKITSESISDMLDRKI